MKWTIPLFIGCGLMIALIIFKYWWNEHAPYCCTHICGATYSMADCWGNIVLIFLPLISIFFITISVYYFMLGGSTNKK